MIELVFIRHSETKYNRDGIFPSRKLTIKNNYAIIELQMRDDKHYTIV